MLDKENNIILYTDTNGKVNVNVPLQKKTFG